MNEVELRIATDELVGALRLAKKSDEYNAKNGEVVIAKVRTLGDQEITLRVQHWCTEDERWFTGAYSKAEVAVISYRSTHLDKLSRHEI